jgi:hypothetical protein
MPDVASHHGKLIRRARLLRGESQRVVVGSSKCFPESLLGG